MVTFIDLGVSFKMNLRKKKRHVVATPDVEEAVQARLVHGV